MDVNGTRFHLILGPGDWSAARELAGASVGAASFYDKGLDALTLRPLPSIFRPSRPTPPLGADDRRGAGADRFGNWYWISADERGILWAPPGGRSARFWGQEPQDCPPPSDFAPVNAAPPDRLAGLAVTEQHYLVVGSAGRGALYIFDLHASGEPLLLSFPAGVPFEPFDIAPAAGGGVWVLDRANRRFWGLDRDFRLLAEPELPPEPLADRGGFGPLDGPAPAYARRQFPTGFAVAAMRPIAVEGLPDGSVLVLDQPAPGASAGALYRHRLGALLDGPVPLSDVVAVELGGGLVAERIDVIGHDMAVVPDEQPGQATLYVADDDGKQVIGFRLSYDAGLSLEVLVDYLPLHAYGGRALTAAELDGELVPFSDVTAGRDRRRDAATRWTAVQLIEQPRYAYQAELLLGGPGSDPTLPPHFDGHERACVWHRLFVDACIPAETAVEVSTRAADSLEELESVPFRAEPALYLRTGGAEMPYYQPFADGGDLNRGRGTWELLFQAACGRFLQVRLGLRGNGRATPQLRAARIYYPRFSYARRFLPGVYQDDAESAAFTERLLANHEGFYSELEGKISMVGSLFDARIAPPESLDWLAGWWGLVLDPLWAQLGELRQRASGKRSAPDRRQPAPGKRSAPDRRRLFIRFARTLFERRGTAAGIRFALHLLLDPCLEETLTVFQAATTQTRLGLRDELASLGLPYPTPTMSDDALEDLLYAYVLAPNRPAKIRIVERFQTRGGRALALGDPGSQGDERDDAAAHRFAVLVPERLSPAEAAMVERVVELEKPAHTLFEVRRYFDYFRAGEARLGLDTVLGDEGRFVAMVLDRNELAAGYLAPAPPMDAPNRVIVGRDQISRLPPL